MSPITKTLRGMRRQTAIAPLSIRIGVVGVRRSVVPGWERLRCSCLLAAKTAMPGDGLGLDTERVAAVAAARRSDVVSRHVERGDELPFRIR